MGPNPLRGRRGAVGATRRMRGERGQVVVIVGVSLLALLGLGALTIDTGSWFGDGRRVQKITDAAALAGAYQLATAHSGNATSAALASIAQNGGSTAPTCKAPPSPSVQGGALDTITVTCDRNSPSFLANLFGITSAHIHETATARVFGINQATGVLPIAVEEDNAIQWASQPSVTLHYRGGEEDEDTGRFGLLDLSKYGCQNTRDSNGQLTSAAVGNCIQNGAPGQVGPVPVDICRAKPQLDEKEQQSVPEPTNDYSTYRQPFDTAFSAISGKQVLLPVYDNAESSGDGDDSQHSSISCSSGSGDGDDEEEGGGSYHIVGFAVFVLQSATVTKTEKLPEGDEGDGSSFLSITGQFLGFVKGATGGGCICGANTVSITQ